MASLLMDAMLRGEADEPYKVFSASGLIITGNWHTVGLPAHPFEVRGQIIERIQPQEIDYAHVRSETAANS